MSKHGLLIGVITIVITVFVLWWLGGPPPCPDGKIAVMGEGKWFCVEGTEVPTRAGG